MDLVFFRALLSALSDKEEIFCVLAKSNGVILCTNPAQTYETIEAIPQGIFATGWQNHEGNSGHWTVWNNISHFEITNQNDADFLHLDHSISHNWESDISQDEYIDTVESMQNGMKKGDFFLANLTRSSSSNRIIDPCHLALMSCIYHQTPNRFFYYSKSLCVLGLSPESFADIRENETVCQPMKGTNSNHDALRKDEKEFEESTMMIDLCRSELSKVCIPQSIELVKRNSLTSHPGLFQMSSTIKGKLSGNQTIGEAVTKMMPIASVTGTPKPYVVKMLNKLEKGARGLYCGAYGYIDNKTRECSLKVAIRTIEVKDSKPTIGVGAGITIKSNPELEWQETELKLGRLTALCELSSQQDAQGVFTSTAIDENQKVFELKKHCSRLSDNAKRLGIQIEKDHLFEKTMNFLKTQDINYYSKIKIIVTLDKRVEFEFEKINRKMGPNNVGIAWFAQVNQYDETIKSLNRSRYKDAMVQAQHYANTEISDALLLQSNKILETTRANVFARFGDIIVSPIDSDALRGTFQESALQSLPERFVIKSKELFLENLYNCDELITTNSVRGPIQVCRISNSLVGIEIKFSNNENILFDELELQFKKGFR